MASIRLHRNASIEKLGALRILVFGILLVYMLATPLELLAGLPADVFEPRGPLLLLSANLRAELCSYEGLRALRWSIAGLSLLCALGVRGYRVWAPLCAVAFIMFEAILSLNANAHRELLLVYSVVVLAFVPADTALRVGRARGRRSAEPTVPLDLLSFVVLFSYAVTGFYRLAHGAPDVFVDHSMAAHLVSNAGRNGAFGWTFGQQFVGALGPTSALLGGMLLVGTLLEAAAFAALFSDRFRIVFVSAIVAFHTANLILLNIEFTLNTALVLALLLDWDPWKRRGRPRRWAHYGV